MTTQDQAEEFAKHIKKFGAFSKMKLEEVGTVFQQQMASKLNFLKLKLILTLGKFRRFNRVKLGLLKQLSIFSNRKSYVYINVMAFILTKVVILVRKLLLVFGLKQNRNTGYI